MILRAGTEQRWRAYVVSERDAIRSVMLPALDAFLAELEAEPTDARTAWALDLASRVADHADSTKVRAPLFRRALLPALIDGIATGKPGCARWLAHFGDLLFHWPGDLPVELRSPVALYLAALRADPDDERSRDALVRARAGWMEYSLHELPSGVLYGHNGASIEQCRELIEMLNEFGEHVERLGQRERYTELIARCQLHYPAYMDYLESGRPGGSYAAYLRALGVDPDRV